MSDTDALLFANEVFYRAFCDADMLAVADAWAEEEPVTCLHPGWAPLTGLEEVLASFQAILNGPAPPQITVTAAEGFLYGDVGIVICYEQIGRDYLIATNVFRRAGSRWRMVHHQAGPVNDPPPRTEEPARPIN